MNCEQAQVLISAQLDGELAAADRAALDGHIAECPACRETDSAFQGQDSQLRRAFTSRREAAVSVADRVIKQLRATSNLQPTPGQTEIIPLGTASSSPLGAEGRGGARPASRRLPWLPMLLSAAAGFLLAALIFRPWLRPTENVARTDPATHQQPTGDPNRDGEQPKPPSDRLAQKSAAELTVAMGVIEMLSPGHDQWERMGTGSTIEAGTRVRTGPEGRCEFLTCDGSEVRLNVNTELVFLTNRKLELAQGQVWSTVAKDEDRYEVHVPRAEATVAALGTQFDLACADDGTLLTVVEGVTKVEGSGGKESYRVQAKEQARIIGGAVAEKHRVYNLVIATSWVHEILKLKGHDNPELVRRMDDLFAQIGEGKMTHLGEAEIIALGDHCVMPLTRFIQSDRSKTNRERRVAAASILAKIAQPWSVPDLIDLLSDSDGGVRYHAAAALQRLTDGETQGLKLEDWSRGANDHLSGGRQRWRLWWEKNQDAYPKNPFAPDEADPAAKRQKA